MKNIALALGGGGTKGFAHIGVISQLEDMGFHIKAIAGTSAGGIVGALYAYGFSIKEIINFSKNLKYSDLFDRINFDSPSLLGFGGFYHEIEKILGISNIEDLNIKFAAVSVDINTGREVILDSGKVIDAVKATTAVPGIFPSQTIKDYNLVDGGILDPVPVRTARWLAPELPIFAISLTPQMEIWPNIPRLEIPPYLPIPQFLVEQLHHLKIGQAMHVFIDSMELMMNTVADLRLKIDKPDVIIRPAVHKYTMFDNVDLEEMIDKGKQAVITLNDEVYSLFNISKRINRWFKVKHPPGILISKS